MTGLVGIAGIGSYAPPRIITAGVLAQETGIPENVLREKFGIRHVHRAGPDCHVSDMAAEAARCALRDAGIAPKDVDLVIYCGSEYKDYIVWSAASKLTQMLGATRAQAFEVYALCAGAPIALRVARTMMLSEPELHTVLVVAASKESSLVNRTNARARFMFNFGDGAGAVVLQRGLDRNVVLATASVTDGELAEDAIMPAGGSRLPPNADTVRSNLHYLDVPDMDHMRCRLDAVSGPNFLSVIRDALRRSGEDQVDFLAPVHMKRSMYDWLVGETGAKRSFYLEEYGHMQAADQFVILDEARHRDLLSPGDVVVLAAAGVGYTWAATVVRWGVA